MITYLDEEVSMRKLTTNYLRCRILGLLFSMVITIGASSQARAGFEVGNLSSNNGFSTTSGFNLTGPQTFTGQGYAIAVKFTVASPTSVSFDSAELGLVYRNGTNAVDVSLMTDDGGVPGGTALETIHLSNISAIPSLVTATSTVHSVLAAGASYWLVAVYGAGDTSVGWLGNTSGQVGNSAYRPDSSGGIGSWVAGPSYTDPSFAVFGQAVPNAGLAAVKAPPTVVLLGIGCLGLVSGRYLKRYRILCREAPASIGHSEGA